MRRSDREIPEKASRELLERGEYGILSMGGIDGPYGVPVNYAVKKNTIFFHSTAAGGLKAELLAANPHVCFTVVGHTQVQPKQFSTRYESVIVFGRCFPVVDDTEKCEALRCLAAKYSPDFMAQAESYITAATEKVSVYSVSIETITGKARK